MSDEERFARLEERVTNWMETTTEYRKNLCGKIDKIFEKIHSLPCEARYKVSDSLKEEISWLQKIIWTVAIMGIPALISLGVAYSALSVTVSRNTGIIQRLEETSYGFRGIKVVTEDSLKKEEANGKTANTGNS